MKVNKSYTLEKDIADYVNSLKEQMNISSSSALVERVFLTLMLTGEFKINNSMYNIENKEETVRTVESNDNLTVIIDTTEDIQEIELEKEKKPVSNDNISRPIDNIRSRRQIPSKINKIKDDLENLNKK